MRSRFGPSALLWDETRVAGPPSATRRYPRDRKIATNAIHNDRHGKLHDQFTQHSNHRSG